MLGIAALMSLVAYPVWGLVADTLLGRDRTLMLAAVLAALAGAGIVVSGDQPTWLAIFIVAQIVCIAPWAPVADALALTELGNHARAYGRMRSGTSAGWIGGGPDRGRGGQHVRACSRCACLFVVAALGLASVVAARRSPRALLRRPERIASGERLTWSAFRTALRASPIFLPFLGVLLVSSIATNAAYAFISLRVLDQGGGPMIIALASCLPAFVEVPLFTQIGRISERFGLRAMFVAGCILSAVQMIVVAIAPAPAIIALVRLIDGAGFTLRYSSLVLISGAALPERLRATGQSMASLMTAGIAPIVSGPVGGWIYGAFGGAALFATCAAVLGAAAGLAYVVLAPLAAARRALSASRPAPEPGAAEP